MPTYEAVVNLSWNGASGSPGVNVFHFRTAPDINDTNQVKSASDRLEAFYTAIKGLYPSSVQISHDGFWVPVTGGGSGIAGGNDWQVQGDGGPNYAPPGLALLANLSPQRGTGRGQGRKFIGPLAYGILTNNGTPSESARDTLRDAARDSLIQSLAFDGSFALWSPGKNLVRDIVAVSVPNRFGQIRSRRD